MKSENILEALNDIDHDMVEDSEEKRKKSKKSIILKWSALAACLILVVGLVLEMLPPPIPVYENAMFSAAEIGKMMNSYTNTSNGTTNAYREIQVSSPEKLNIIPVPEGEYMDCVLHHPTQVPLNDSEYSAFWNSAASGVWSKIGAEPQPYKCNANDYFIWVSYEDLGKDKITVRGKQDDSYNEIHIISDREDPLKLNSIPIQIAYGSTEQEIESFVSSIRGLIFEMFGVSFSDMKIIVRDDKYIYVYFYNIADHILNETTNIPITDYIRLFFSHSTDGSIMACQNATYCQYRSTVDERYTMTSLRRIPLKEAEALLYKGYVFGGHMCPQCQAGQEKISFRNYDYVGFYYYRGYPFYAFYKQIESNEDGLTYALTYVPAFEVSGYEEYFKSQEAAHRS